MHVGARPDLDMHHLADLLGATLEHTSFLVGSRRLSARQFKESHARRSWNDKDVAAAGRTEVAVDSGRLSALASWIRAVLDDYVEPSTDRIGHAFPIAGSGGLSTLTVGKDSLFVREFASPIENFATALVGGAALLGPERVARLVSDWDRGAPIAYQTRSLLNGGGMLSGPLSLLAGVRVESLPLSTDQLSGFLPLPAGRSQAAAGIR